MLSQGNPCCPAQGHMWADAGWDATKKLLLMQAFISSSRHSSHHGHAAPGLLHHRMLLADAGMCLVRWSAVEQPTKLQQWTPAPSIPAQAWHGLATSPPFPAGPCTQPVTSTGAGLSLHPRPHQVCRARLQPVTAQRHPARRLSSQLASPTAHGTATTGGAHGTRPVGAAAAAKPPRAAPWHASSSFQAASCSAACASNTLSESTSSAPATFISRTGHGTNARRANAPFAARG